MYAHNPKLLNAKGKNFASVKYLPSLRTNKDRTSLDTSTKNCAYVCVPETPKNTVNMTPQM